MRQVNNMMRCLSGCIVVLFVVSQYAIAAPPTASDAKPIQLPGDNPLAKFFAAKNYEQSGEFTKAAKVYYDLINTAAPNSPWGAWARLSLLRLQLESGDLKAAKQTFSELPSELGNPLSDRQLRLWSEMIKLYEQVDRLAQPQTSELITIKPPSFDLPRIPVNIRVAVAKSFDALRRRLEKAKKTKEGTAFLQSLLCLTSNAFIQTVALSNIAKMSASNGDMDTASTACRAYWLSAVDFPELFTDTVRTAMTVMKAAGASNAQVEAFRQYQMRGEAGGDRPAADPLRAGKFAKQIFVQQLESADNDLSRARLLLLDGELIPACRILDIQVRKAEVGSDIHSEALLLIRMAMALHDGHMHLIDRYERFLFGSQENGVDPLSAILAEGDHTQSAAASKVH